MLVCAGQRQVLTLDIAVDVSHSKVLGALKNHVNYCKKDKYGQAASDWLDKNLTGFTQSVAWSHGKKSLGVARLNPA